MKHAHKIAVVGDSVTEGANLDDADTYPVRLEEILNKKTGGRYFSVINAGVQGYSPIQERLVFELKVSKQKPDIVIWQIIENDLYDILNYKSLGTIRYYSRFSALYWYLRYKWGDFRYKYFIAPKLNDIKDTEHLLTPSTTEARADPPAVENGKLQASPPKTQVEVDQLPSMKPNQNFLVARPILQKELERFHVVAKDVGSKVLVVFFPSRNHVEGNAIASTDVWLEEISISMGFNYLSLSPVFSGLPKDELFTDSVHLTPKGARWAAEEIAVELIRNGLIASHF